MKTLSETSIVLTGNITDDWRENIFLNQKTAWAWADSINQNQAKLTDVYVVSLEPKFAKQLSTALSELGLHPNVHVLKQNSKITNLTAINGGKEISGWHFKNKIDKNADEAIQKEIEQKKQELESCKAISPNHLTGTDSANRKSKKEWKKSIDNQISTLEADIKLLEAKQANLRIYEFKDAACPEVMANPKFGITFLNGKKSKAQKAPEAKKSPEAQKDFDGLKKLLKDNSVLEKTLTDKEIVPFVKVFQFRLDQIQSNIANHQSTVDTRNASISSKLAGAMKMVNANTTTRDAENKEKGWGSKKSKQSKEDKLYESLDKYHRTPNPQTLKTVETAADIFQKSSKFNPESGAIKLYDEVDTLRKTEVAFNQSLTKDVNQLKSDILSFVGVYIEKYKGCPDDDKLHQSKVAVMNKIKDYLENPTEENWKALQEATAPRANPGWNDGFFSTNVASTMESTKLFKEQLAANKTDDTVESTTTPQKKSRW